MYRRYSLRVEAVAAPSATGCIVEGTVWLGPITTGDVFSAVVHDLDGTAAEERIALRVVTLHIESSVAAQAAPGDAVSCVLRGEGFLRVRPSDVILGEEDT